MSGAAPQNDSQRTTLSPVLERNIHTLLERRAREDRERGMADRIADSATRIAGSMTFVTIHLFAVAGWILWNSRWSPLPKFDPSLVILAMVASVESIFLSAFILITQNRLTALSSKRADLDLQISLLSEHEITRMMDLVSAIARKMGLEESKSADIEDLKKDVAPERVLEKLEEGYRENNTPMA